MCEKMSAQETLKASNLRLLHKDGLGHLVKFTARQLCDTKEAEAIFPAQTSPPLQDDTG